MSFSFFRPFYFILQLTVRNGNFEGLEGLDPTISWSDSSQSGDLDFAYGIKAAVRPTSDLASLPRSIWGKASTDVSGWGVSALAELDGQDFTKADLEIDATNEEQDISVHVEANAAKEFSVSSIEATKGFDQDGARITVTPRYDLQTEERDVVVTYSKDKINVKLTASSDAQELTVSQQIDEDNRIAPTINNNGDISVEWERRLSDTSTLTANLKPNDYLDVEWKDDDWTANVNIPIDGTDIKAVDVSISREVNF